MKERKCRVCGCTQENCRQCIEKTGQPCTWVDEDLCSACVVEAEIVDQIIKKLSAEGISKATYFKTAAEAVLMNTAMPTKLIEYLTRFEELVRSGLPDVTEEENNQLTTKTNTMEFFKKLQPLFGLELKINITKTGDKMTVGLFPQHKNAEILAKLKPVLLTGTADELDEGFFDKITPVMETMAGIITNIEGINDELKDLEGEKKDKVEKKKSEPVKKAEGKKPVKPKKEKPAKKQKPGKKKATAPVEETEEQETEEEPGGPKQESIF